MLDFLRLSHQLEHRGYTLDGPPTQFFELLVGRRGDDEGDVGQILWIDRW